MNRAEAVEFLLTKPYKFGHMIGFTDLTELHNDWIISMIRGKDDSTLQAHRGSYKTSCVSVALAIVIILLPKIRTMFMRKTDGDVKEVIKQVQKILSDPHTGYFVQCIYGVNLKLVTQSTNEITTNLVSGASGTAQLLGIGMGGSLTGKHFDLIFTDDIVNVNDRVSRAEREKTKLVYQELQNIKNRGGRIINTGTPWHKDDCFSIMPEAQKYDCYTTGIITEDELKSLKASMLPSLFAANYELRHIASEDVIFDEPKVGYDSAKCEQGIMQVDSAFYGEDYTAWSVMKRVGDDYYCYGRMKRKHVEECYDDIKADYERFLCGKIYNEDNADKGMVSRDMRRQGMKVVSYHESMNKYLKIVTYLKAIWDNLYFVEGTDKAFIEQICEYTDNAEHDDAPDSLASLARICYNKPTNDTYTPIYMR